MIKFPMILFKRGQLIGIRARFVCAIKFRDWIATRTGAANQSLLSNVAFRITDRSKDFRSFLSDESKRPDAPVRSRPYATARYSHAYDRTPPLAYRRFGSKAGHRKTRKPRRTERNGLRVVVEAGNRAYVISSSRSPAECTRARIRDAHAHARIAARETHDSPCGSIISQKSDNWFINALAASAIYRLITPFRTTEPERRSLSAIIDAASISQPNGLVEHLPRSLKTSKF